jgi:putative flippase GtrA
MAFPAADLYSRVRTKLSPILEFCVAGYPRYRAMLPEIFKFCVIGGLGTVIDLGGAAVLHGTYHFEPLAAKAVSVSLATVFTYLGSRFWTFKERENQSVRREAVLFLVLNIVGLLIAEAVIGLVTYVMGLHSSLEYNAASFVGTGLGTIFRFWAYRKWVFLAPDSASTAAPAPQTPAFPDYPPWELDPAYLLPTEAAAQTRPFPAPTYSSPLEPEPVATGNQGIDPAPWGAPNSQTVPFSAQNFAEPNFAASGFRAPVADAPPPPAAPVPPAAPAPPAAPRSSGGGRHRKS